MHIIEVTGVSAVGKSTWLKSHKKPERIVYDNKDINNYFLHFLAQTLKLVLFCFKRNSLSSIDIIWLFKYSMRLNESFHMRINVFRNCILKFINQENAKKNALQYDSPIIYVDEGISHIPFLLQNQPNNKIIIESFYIRFSSQLSKIDVICLKSKANIFFRLKDRGHKRLKNSDDAKITKFVNMNEETLCLMIENASAFKTFNIIEVD